MLLGFELHMELHILNRSNFQNIQLIPPYLATLLLCSRYPHREPVTAQIPVVPASSQSSATSHGHPENPQASFRTTTSIPLSSNSAVPCTGHCHDQLKFKAEHEKGFLFVCLFLQDSEFQTWDDKSSFKCQILYLWKSQVQLVVSMSKQEECDKTRGMHKGASKAL